MDCQISSQRDMAAVGRNSRANAALCICKRHQAKTLRRFAGSGNGRCLAAAKRWLLPMLPFWQDRPSPRQLATKAAEQVASEGSAAQNNS
jgi:hypothetical protein